MKITNFLFCGFVGVSFASVASAAAFYDNFDAYAPDTELHGVNGWTVDAANIPSAVPNLPGGLASSTNFGSGSDVWGTLGGRFSFPNTVNVELSHSAALPLAGTQFRVDFDIVGSTGTHLNRDMFGWSLKDGAASDLIRFAFEPGVAGKMEVVWYQGATRTSTGMDVSYGGAYTLTASFLPSGANMAFNASIIGLNTVPFSGVLTGAGAANIASVNADFDVVGPAAGAGNNFMAFNNLVVPEPSSMLTAGLALMGMTFRRRR